MDSSQFPWRPLGALLVDRGLLTEADLERALTEQRRTGRVLGQILVGRGYVSGIALARALAEQHGVELRPTGETERKSSASGFAHGLDGARPFWRPLGRLLVERGLVGQGELERALAEQLERPELHLGEILVERGYLDGPALARALADQHGVDIGPEEDFDLETVVNGSQPGEPRLPGVRGRARAGVRGRLRALRAHKLPRGCRLRR